LKRIYDAKADDDGQRILVDRLWPRGIKKEDAGIDLWLRDVAPSPALRQWFGHDPSRWTEFRKRYREELRQDGAVLEDLRARCKGQAVTLLFAAKDTKHNHAVVLRDLLSGSHEE
jgi:uncharacterized protein YeaO (DUF488 family)